MTQNELNEIIEKHQHYLNRDIDGWENMRADLSHQDLSGLNLPRKDLRYIRCNETILNGVNFYHADLRGADLSYANLIDADLRNADLRKANFRHTDLSGADFYRADLSGVDLSYANLYRTDLWHAELLGTKIDYPLACPETGSFVGYKKAYYNCIVKLQICEDAKRSSATTKKCRCSKALVLAIENMDGSDSGLQEIESNFDPSFIYRVGEIAEVSDFDENRWNECAPGIHFFVDRQDAVEYEF